MKCSDKTVTTLDSIKHFFDAFSVTYENDILYKSLGTKFCSYIELKFIMDSCPQLKGKRVLDIGIGTGRISCLLLRMGATIHGIDISEKMMEISKKRFKGKPVSFEIASLEDPLPFENDTFDCVVCIRVLKYVRNWRMAIKEISRVLRKNGDFLMDVPNSFSVAIIGKRHTRYFLFNCLSFAANLHKEGFEIQKICAGLRFPFPLYVRVNNRLLLHWLIKLESLIDSILPTYVLSRNILISCKKR